MAATKDDKYIDTETVLEACDILRKLDSILRGDGGNLSARHHG